MMSTGRRPSLRTTGLPSRSSQRSSVATQGLSLTTSLVEVPLKQRGGPDGFSRCEHVFVAHPHLHPHSSYPLVCRGLPGDPVESLNLSPYFFEEERLGPAAAPPVSRPLFLAFGGAPSLHSPCHAVGREWRERHRAATHRTAHHPRPPAAPVVRSAARAAPPCPRPRGRVSSTPPTQDRGIAFSAGPSCVTPEVASGRSTATTSDAPVKLSGALLLD
jgi:hypothetical protein